MRWCFRAGARSMAGATPGPASAPMCARPIGGSGRRADEGSDRPVLMQGDSLAQAFGDRTGALDEMLGGGGRTDFARGLLEQSQPAQEMGPLDRQIGVLLH